MSKFTLNLAKAAMTVELSIDGDTVSINGNPLPVISRDRAIAYGVKQLLDDSCASVAVSAKIDGRKVALKGKELAAANVAAAKLVNERLSDMFNGVLRRVRTSGDPVESRARQIAIRQVQKDSAFRAWVAAQGIKFTDEKATNELAERAGKLIESNPKIREIAARQIADEADLMADESDVAEAA